MLECHVNNYVFEPDVVILRNKGSTFTAKLEEIERPVEEELSALESTNRAIMPHNIPKSI